MHNNLPKYYHFISKFEKDDIKNLNKNIAIIYRNYNQKIDINFLLEKIDKSFKQISNNIK